MARRKRLAPLPDPVQPRAPEVKSATPAPVGLARPPIAQVAGDASSAAALAELAREFTEARESGRMVLSLPLDAVDETYLVRDRVLNDGDEMEALIASLRDRGQQVPIEVVALEGGRYGLISGWRRLQALRQLKEEGQGAGVVQALLRRPEGAADAYRAMVEENEIRVGLSYYERARIVARAAELDVYHSTALALKGLFGAASRAKRSKIGKFVKLYEALDGALSFPGHIPERLGLRLAGKLEDDPKFAVRLADRLRKTPPANADDEMALLERAASGKQEKKSLTDGFETVSSENLSAAQSAKNDLSVSLTKGAEPNMLVLRGGGVTPAFERELRDWLEAKRRGG